LLRQDDSAAVTAQPTDGLFDQLGMSHGLELLAFGFRKQEQLYP
jgi:hypothetical protein